MEEALIEYQKILERMFNADNWLKSKGIDSWEDIKGKRAYALLYPFGLPSTFTTSSA